MDNFEVLEQFGWIKRKEFLWWDFKHKNDIRKYYSNFNDFMNLFTKLGQRMQKELYVTFNEEIPITSLPLKFDDQIVNFMVTARPFTEKELKQYFGDLHGFQPRPKGKYFDENKKFLKKEDLMRELEKQINSDSSELADHFFPHIRGIIKEINENSIFYYPMFDACHGTKPNREEWIIKKLTEENKRFLQFEFQGYGLHDITDANINAFNFCVENNLLYRVKNSMNYRVHKPIKFNRKFSLELYNEISLDGSSQYSYYPIKINGISQSIPFAITNNFYKKRGLFNVGLISFEGFYPIDNKEMLIESSRKLSEIFSNKVHPVYFERHKGSLIPKLLDQQ